MSKIALAFLPAIVAMSIMGCLQDQTEQSAVVFSDTKQDQAGQSTIVFSDPNLEAAMREAIDKPEGPINVSDLERLEILNLNPYDITDISPLSKCTNLKDLIKYSIKRHI